MIRTNADAKIRNFSKLPAICRKSFLDVSWREKKLEDSNVDVIFVFYNPKISADMELAKKAFRIFADAKF